MIRLHLHLPLFGGNMPIVLHTTDSQVLKIPKAGWLQKYMVHLLQRLFIQDCTLPRKMGPCANMGFTTTQFGGLDMIPCLDFQSILKYISNVCKTALAEISCRTWGVRCRIPMANVTNTLTAQGTKHEELGRRTSAHHWTQRMGFPPVSNHHISSII